MTTALGGIGFMMILIAGSCVDSESMTVVALSLGICLAGAALMFVAGMMNEKKNQRYIKKRFS